MGSYLNPGTGAFQMARNSEIFIDKSRLIEETNRHVNTIQRFLCVSRPRRFGKSMAADMLAAYYDCKKDTSDLFDDLQIAQAESYQKYRNKYEVLKINMQEFLSAAGSMEEMLKTLQSRLLSELKRKYPNNVQDDGLTFTMKDVYAETGHAFVILIDEWDCIFREYQNDKESQKKYLDFLRMWLKDAVVKMLAGEEIEINTGTFTNDMVTFATKDDVLTLLLHLGYLTYNVDTKKVRIPNKEVAQEYLNAISTMDWHEVTSSVEMSKKLLEALWEMDAEKVAKGIDRAHKEISILTYNDENSLSCTIQLAFYFAREYYAVVRELPAGRGFADIVFIPRPYHQDKPAVIMELKWNKNVQGAIAQIKEKQYTDALRDYHGNLLLAGITYDRDSKQHTCVIEKMIKE